jgi:hypothetical protein
LRDMASFACGPTLRIGILSSCSMSSRSVSMPDVASVFAGFPASVQ